MARIKNDLASILEYKKLNFCRFFYIKDSRLVEFPQKFNSKDSAKEIISLIGIKQVMEPKLFRRHLHCLDRMYFDAAVTERNKSDGIV